MQLNKIFTSHMVFAANKPIRFFGNGKGTAEINFAGHKRSLSSNNDFWILEFEPMEYGGPYSAQIIFEDEEIVLEDIYVGEVYLFAGQSNLQFKLSASSTPQSLYESNDKLRLYSTDKIEKTDRFDSKDGWLTCKKEYVGDWSAVAFLTGREITKVKGIAVGAVACYQGASIIESWVPKGAFKNIGIDIPANKKTWSHSCKEYSEFNGEGRLYNFAFLQVVPFSFSGVIWYQGESDTTVDEAKVYSDELAELIRIWRSDLNDEKLPFYVIQIADFINDNNPTAWALIQKAQVEVQSKTKGVKTIISADVCENDDIHPKTKDKLSKRIAAAILQDI